MFDEDVGVKLNECMELAKKYEEKGGYLSLNIRLAGAAGTGFVVRFSERMGAKVQGFHFYSIDEALDKIKRLLVPAPKYKVGDEVFYLDWDTSINKGCVTHVFSDDIIRYHIGCRFSGLQEDRLFASKEKLVSHYVDYFHSELNLS